MQNSETRKELRREFFQEQSKYTYYVVALCVTAIGFSTYKTFGMSLKWTQIFLALAVAFWGLSIYCGLQFIRYKISTMFLNIKYLEVLDGKVEGVRINLSDAMDIADKLKDEIKSNSKNGFSLSGWQYRLFCGGFISFLIWHIIEMYFNNR